MLKWSVVLTIDRTLDSVLLCTVGASENPINKPFDMPNPSLNTPSKTNMEPKNGGLEDENPFQRRDFQVPC